MSSMDLFAAGQFEEIASIWVRESYGDDEQEQTDSENSCFFRGCECTEVDFSLHLYFPDDFDALTSALGEVSNMALGIFEDHWAQMVESEFTGSVAVRISGTWRNAISKVQGESISLLAKTWVKLSDGLEEGPDPDDPLSDGLALNLAELIDAARIAVAQKLDLVFCTGP